MNNIVRHNGKLINRAQLPNWRKITKKERFEVFERDGFKCVKCGSTKKLTIDHIIPKSKGGRDSVNNYQTMCLKCNQEKKDEIKAEYLRTY